MKTVKVTEEFYNAALKLAQYVDNDDSEYDSLVEFIKEGGNKENHILNYAAIVGGWDDSLDEYISEKC